MAMEQVKSEIAVLEGRRALTLYNPGYEQYAR